MDIPSSHQTLPTVNIPLPPITSSNQADPKLLNNPMKKRFRSWELQSGTHQVLSTSFPQNSSVEPPIRRRRYPRLVVRDTDGNFKANPIATAPKVALPLEPVYPRHAFSSSIPPPKTSTLKPTLTEQPPSKGLTQLAETAINASKSLPSKPVPMHPPLHSLTPPRAARKKTPLHATPLTPQSSSSHPISNLTRLPNSPKPESSAIITMPLRQPGPPVKAPDIMHPPHSQTRVMPATSFYQPRPVPHFSTSLPQSTVSKDVIRPNDSHPVPLHPNLALSSNHAPRFVSNGYNSTPRDVPSDMVAKDGVDRCNKSLVAQHLKGPTSPPVPAMEPNLYNKVSPVLKIQDVGHSRISNVAPHMGNQSATTQHPSSEMDPNGKPILLSNGKVIQAGKRCGTVQYWRSSLQMPRVAVDINASSKGEISNTKKEMTIGTEFRSNHILKKGDSAQYGSQEESSVDVSARDIRIGRTGAELHKVGDSGNQHAFWRNATKLPRAVFDESRLKRLTSGRRKMNCSNLQHVEGGKDELGAYYDATKEAVADVDFNGDSGYAQGMLVDNRSGSTTECPMNEKAFQREARSLPEDDEYETRRLNLTREYELKRLRSLAQGKFSVKMNLRGRTKLESWLGSSVVTVKSTELIVVMFQLDNRVLSSRPEDRREALLNMENEDLRILEALMLRVTNRGGNANWLLLTGNFNTNNFEDKNNLEWRRKARMT